MKRFFLIALAMLMLLTACSPKEKEAETSPAETETKEETTNAEPPAPDPDPENTPEPDTEEEPKALVIYFSRVGNTDFPDDIDAEATASVVRRDGDICGNAELMARWAQEESGGELYLVRTKDKYPVVYRETIDLALKEKNDGYRPEIEPLPDNIGEYNKVFLIFPNWWGDLPMALYTFFEQADLSGAELYVSVTHGGSGFSRTVDTLKALQPTAEVIEGLSLRDRSVPDAEEQVKAWVRGAMDE